jgi:L-sorbose 1-phosphate reductase
MSRPTSQVAVQLVGPHELALNLQKPLPPLGPRQILVKVEAVGLCFSDMKLLSQFSGHVRKGEVIAGADQEALRSLPSYVPGDSPTVPGHEVVCRVVEVGPDVAFYRVGDRHIVQADYRPLKTDKSNGAFGYNFEGGLQQFVILDERVIGDPANEESFMIPVPLDQPSSQAALVEPWACVENSYAAEERQGLNPEGSLWSNRPAFAQERPGRSAEGDVDDLLLVGLGAEEVEAETARLGKNGLCVLLQEGRRFDRPVQIDVGRLHYMGQRYVGTWGADVSEALAMIPPTLEIQPSDRVLVVGAGGPMGQMHVIRALSEGQGEVVATDTSLERLEALEQKLRPWRGRFRTLLAVDLPESETFDVVALMAPLPFLVQDAIARSREGARINVFAGIPVGSRTPLDLNQIFDRRIYMFGTSGSEPSDMRVVLQKVLKGQLDTNLSVAAVSGMAGAIHGLHAVEGRTLDGKIVVYPSLPNLPLIPIADLGRWYPTVAEKLQDGQWTGAAEAELLRVGA